MIELLGWLATAVFVSSYFFRRPALMPIVQMSGAALWILYGALIGASPVIVANALVAGGALWTVVRARRREDVSQRVDPILAPRRG